MKFRLTTILYVFALLAAAMGTFGPGVGIFLTGVIVALWSFAKRGTAVRGVVVILGIVWLIYSTLNPVMSAARDTARMSMSYNQSKLLWLHLDAYKKEHGQWPPAATTDSDGRPLHSWRTLLSPYHYMEALYKQLKLDEPWDSLHNKPLVEGVQLSGFQSSRVAPAETRADETHFFAVVGEGAAWNELAGANKGIDASSVKGVLLIEAGGLDTAWYEPRDLSLDEAVEILVGESTFQGTSLRPGFFISERLRGDGLIPRVVVFADGSQRVVRCFVQRTTAREFLTSGYDTEFFWSDEVEWRETDELVIGHIIHWGRVWGLAVFVGLSVAPFFWGREQKRGPAAAATT